MLTIEKFKDPEYISAIKKHLRNNGFCCDAYKPSYLQRRILVRLRSNHLDSFSQYYRLLRRDPKEYRNLLDTLTINVTHFFRDSDVYQILQNQVIPDFLKPKKPGSTIRIWSAGCASGEEAYSVAMLVLESLEKDRDKYNVSIFATDIDERSLKTAREGNYSRGKLEKMPQYLVRKYFVLAENYSVKQELKSHIKFKKLDLLSDKGIKFCDAIFCRNVLIYFNREDQEKIMQMFHESLQTNGLLVLGKVESLSRGFGSLFSCVDRRTHIYKKIDKSLVKVEGNAKMSQVY